MSNIFMDGWTKPDANAPLTPVEYHDGLWLKRDDLFSVGGVAGGKVRTCLHLAQGAIGLVTAGSRSSPQVNIVAHIAQHLGIPARAHTPCGPLLPELLDAKATGCEIVQETPGHNSVIIARARKDAQVSGWTEIPFGMECPEAVRQTRGQVRNIPSDIDRIYMPVGSGMSLAGVLWGLQDIGLHRMPVTGVVVGANPCARLDRFAPADWRKRVVLLTDPRDYHEAAPATLDGIVLDSFYEGKVVPHLKPGSLFWIVGVRATVGS